LQLWTTKPVLYVRNVGEAEGRLAMHTTAVAEMVAAQGNARVIISARRSQISQFEDDGGDVPEMGLAEVDNAPSSGL
jgi:ribosome-binding ATPase YchF (GTP1/OBG family)